ncbi:hypothetical protein GCM10022226_21320 [Sphaerisporangium flaviroseum]|uniref:Uncharacterized protein n=1 Tax=Sphaerisporangium flaviroseum TaxID=509199 RepID=A0ABP7HTX6_9ACTN
MGEVVRMMPFSYNLGKPTRTAESEGNVALSWEDLPIGRVVRLPGVNADTTALSIEPLPDGAPAILGYFPGAARSVAETVAAVLGELEKAAVELFPAWVPGAEGIDGPGGGGVNAVRALALRMASAGHHFGPYLAYLAESSLTGVVRPFSRFSPEVRAIGLARVLAEGFGRPRARSSSRVRAGSPTRRPAPARRVRRAALHE